MATKVHSAGFTRPPRAGAYMPDGTPVVLFSDACIAPLLHGRSTTSTAAPQGTGCKSVSSADFNSMLRQLASQLSDTAREDARAAASNASVALPQPPSQTYLCEWRHETHTVACVLEKHPRLITVEETIPPPASGAPTCACCRPFHTPSGNGTANTTTAAHPAGAVEVEPIRPEGGGDLVVHAGPHRRAMIHLVCSERLPRAAQITGQTLANASAADGSPLLPPGEVFAGEAALRPFLTVQEEIVLRDAARTMLRTLGNAACHCAADLARSAIHCTCARTRSGPSKDPAHDAAAAAAAGHDGAGDDTAGDLAAAALSGPVSASAFGGNVTAALSHVHERRRALRRQMYDFWSLAQEGDAVTRARLDHARAVLADATRYSLAGIPLAGGLPGQVSAGPVVDSNAIAAAEAMHVARGGPLLHVPLVPPGSSNSAAAGPNGGNSKLRGGAANAKHKAGKASADGEVDMRALLDDQDARATAAYRDLGPTLPAPVESGQVVSPATQAARKALEAITPPHTATAASEAVTLTLLTRRFRDTANELYRLHAPAAVTLAGLAAAAAPVEDEGAPLPDEFDSAGVRRSIGPVLASRARQLARETSHLRRLVELSAARAHAIANRDPRVLWRAVAAVVLAREADGESARRVATDVLDRPGEDRKELAAAALDSGSPIKAPALGHGEDPAAVSFRELMDSMDSRDQPSSREQAIAALARRTGTSSPHAAIADAAIRGAFLEGKAGAMCAMWPRCTSLLGGTPLQQWLIRRVSAQVEAAVPAHDRCLDGGAVLLRQVAHGQATSTDSSAPPASLVQVEVNPAGAPSATLPLPPFASSPTEPAWSVQAMYAMRRWCDGGGPIEIAREAIESLAAIPDAVASAFAPSFTEDKAEERAEEADAAIEAQEHAEQVAHEQAEAATEAAIQAGLIAPTPAPSPAPMPLRATFHALHGERALDAAAALGEWRRAAAVLKNLGLDNWSQKEVPSNQPVKLTISSPDIVIRQPHHEPEAAAVTEAAAEEAQPEVKTVVTETGSVVPASPPGATVVSELAMLQRAGAHHRGAKVHRAGVLQPAAAPHTCSDGSTRFDAIHCPSGAEVKYSQAPPATDGPFQCSDGSTRWDAANCPGGTSVGFSKTDAAPTAPQATGDAPGTAAFLHMWAAAARRRGQATSLALADALAVEAAEAHRAEVASSAVLRRPVGTEESDPTRRRVLENAAEFRFGGRHVADGAPIVEEAGAPVAAENSEAVVEAAGGPTPAIGGGLVMPHDVAAASRAAGRRVASLLLRLNGTLACLCLHVGSPVAGLALPPRPVVEDSPLGEQEDEATVARAEAAAEEAAVAEAVKAAQSEDGPAAAAAAAAGASGAVTSDQEHVAAVVGATHSSLLQTDSATLADRSSGLAFNRDSESSARRRALRDRQHTTEAASDEAEPAKTIKPEDGPPAWYLHEAHGEGDGVVFATDLKGDHTALFEALERFTPARAREAAAAFASAELLVSGTTGRTDPRTAQAGTEAAQRLLGTVPAPLVRALFVYLARQKERAARWPRAPLDLHQARILADIVEGNEGAALGPAALAGGAGDPARPGQPVTAAAARVAQAQAALAAAQARTAAAPASSLMQTDADDMERGMRGEALSFAAAMSSAAAASMSGAAADAGASVLAEAATTSERQLLRAHSTSTVRMGAAAPGEAATMPGAVGVAALAARHASAMAAAHAASQHRFTEAGASSTEVDTSMPSASALERLVPSPMAEHVVMFSGGLAQLSPASVGLPPASREDAARWVAARMREWEAALAREQASVMDALASVAGSAPWHDPEGSAEHNTWPVLGVNASAVQSRLRMLGTEHVMLAGEQARMSDLLKQRLARLKELARQAAQRASDTIRALEAAAAAVRERRDAADAAARKGASDSIELLGKVKNAIDLVASGALTAGAAPADIAACQADLATAAAVAGNGKSLSERAAAAMERLADARRGLARALDKYPPPAPPSEDAASDSTTVVGDTKKVLQVRGLLAAAEHPAVIAAREAADTAEATALAAQVAEHAALIQCLVARGSALAGVGKLAKLPPKHKSSGSGSSTASGDGTTPMGMAVMDAKAAAAAQKAAAAKLAAAHRRLAEERRLWEEAVVRLARPKTCLQLQGLATGGTDGVYTVFPPDDLQFRGVQVYCDMTTDGGGWTLVAHGSRGQVGGPLGISHGVYSPTNRTADAGLNALWVAQASTEVAIAWTSQTTTGALSATPGGPMGSYRAAMAYAIPVPRTTDLALTPAPPPQTCTSDRGDYTVTTVRCLDLEAAREAAKAVAEAAENDDPDAAAQAMAAASTHSAPGGSAGDALAKPGAAGAPQIAGKEVPSPAGTSAASSLSPLRGADVPMPPPQGTAFEGCRLPAQMYTGTQSLGVCHGHAYGVVLRGAPDEDCDGPLDLDGRGVLTAALDGAGPGAPRQGPAQLGIMVGVDGAVGCSGVIDQSRQAVLPDHVAVWMR